MNSEETNRIIDQLQRLHGISWSGIHLDEMLREIDEDMANTEVPFFKNTIHQIVQHIIATEFVVIKRLQNVDHILSEEEDWVPENKLKNISWSETKKKLAESQNDLIHELQKVSLTDLDKPIIENFSSVYVNLHGHIQHSYYHIGQISVIKKILEGKNK